MKRNNRSTSAAAAVVQSSDIYGQQQKVVKNDKDEEHNPLENILAAQNGELIGFPDFQVALKEIRKGRKHSCWMWYIWPSYEKVRKHRMPQMLLQSLDQHVQYLQHDVLRRRLLEITTAAATQLQNGVKPSKLFFGDLDASKVHEACTMFAIAAVAMQDEESAKVFVKAVAHFKNTPEEKNGINNNIMSNGESNHHPTSSLNREIIQSLLEHNNDDTSKKNDSENNQATNSIDGKLENGNSEANNSTKNKSVDETDHNMIKFYIERVQALLDEKIQKKKKSRIFGSFGLPRSRRSSSLDRDEPLHGKKSSSHSHPTTTTTTTTPRSRFSRCGRKRGKNNKEPFEKEGESCFF